MLLLQRAPQFRGAIVGSLLRQGGVLVRLGGERGLRFDNTSGRREILFQPSCALLLVLQGFS